MAHQLTEKLKLLSIVLPEGLLNLEAAIVAESYVL